MPLSAGTRLGSYEILSALGSGGMGEVYRARDTRLDRDVAIKILPEGLARVPDRIARFEREARAVATRSRPRLRAIPAVGTDARAPSAVPDFLDAVPLRPRPAPVPIPPRKAI